MADCRAAERALCSPDVEVSAHYLIDRDGSVTQLVPEDRRAWHAGAGTWGSVTDVNSRSIGIELSNLGVVPFAAAQMDALDRLLSQIVDRWHIPPERVIGHSDLALGRKIDPGPRFDWARLARQGLAVRAVPEVPIEPDEKRFGALLSTIGYPEVAPDVRLVAFRLRHRPRALGPLDGLDMALAQDLAKRFPAL